VPASTSENDEAATKLIWLQLREVTKDWKTPAREWHMAKAQFALVFGDRFEMNHDLIRPVSHKTPDTAREIATVPCVRSRAQMLGLENEFYQKLDVHLHIPEGATPKDGPSAGIGMCTALVSALTKIPVRSDVAMTGEITLRGEVLPIGGLKEKLLAAHRGGIKTVLIPEENQKDLVEIPDNIKGGLEIKAVKWIDEVLELALTARPIPTQAVLPIDLKRPRRNVRRVLKDVVPAH
jgi:ATP-dependent Lon protease